METEVKGIIWTFKAQEDLKNIYEFLCLHEEEEKAFEKISRIVQKIDSLKNNPLRGQKEPKFIKLRKNYRRLIEGNYKIIYHFRTEKIYINRIFDTRQDPKKLTTR